MKKLLATLIIASLAWICLRDIEQMAFGLMIILPVFYMAIGKERNLTK